MQRNLKSPLFHSPYVSSGHTCKYSATGAQAVLIHNPSKSRPQKPWARTGPKCVSISPKPHPIRTTRAATPGRRGCSCRPSLTCRRRAPRSVPLFAAPSRRGFGAAAALPCAGPSLCLGSRRPGGPPPPLWGAGGPGRFHRARPEQDTGGPERGQGGRNTRCNREPRLRRDMLNNLLMIQSDSAEPEPAAL